MSILVTTQALEKTVQAIKEYVDANTALVENWDANSRIDSYVRTGIYHFLGVRESLEDNLPIDNVGENSNIAFTLIVDRVNGNYNETETTINNIPGIISQTLFLGNRQGSETRVYVRNGNIQYSDTDSEGEITWETWRELTQTTYLGVLNSYDALNTTTEIGLYTGAMFNFASRVADVFKLEVINNYAVTTQVSAATGLSTPPNSVLQTITILNLDGSNATKKRIGTYNGNGYTWGEWKDTASEATTKYKRGDVVILQQKFDSSGASIGTKVVSWDNFIENKDSYKYVDPWSEGAYPIGLIVDPQKKTFIYLRTKVIENAPEVSSSEDVFCDLLFNSLHDGLGNTKSLMTQDYIDKNIIAQIPSTSSIFYNGAGGLLTQFIPSRDENVLLNNVFYDHYKGWQDFKGKIEELNAMMGDEDIYPTTYGANTSIFYTYTSSLGKTEDSLSSNVSYTFYSANNQLDVPLYRQDSVTYRMVYGILINDED